MTNITQKHLNLPINTRQDIDAELNTIPTHVLHDEVLYRKYMERELGFQHSRIPGSESSSSGSLSETECKQGGGDSASGLLNILSTMKKAAMQKASAESRKRYSRAVGGSGNRTRQARSEVDLSQIPGSCSYLRKQFDAAEVSRAVEQQNHALKCS